MSDPAVAKRGSAARYTIGRDKDCDVPIADESVSRIHAELTVLEGGKLLLADRASSNGTSILHGGAARRIDRTYVSPADRVQFGSVVLSVGELIEAIQAKARQSASASKEPVQPAGPQTLSEVIGPALRCAWGWLSGSLIHGRWREAVLAALIIAAAVLLWAGDPQSPFFKFMIGILGSLIASMLFGVLQRFWEKK